MIDVPHNIPDPSPATDRGEIAGDDADRVDVVVETARIDKARVVSGRVLVTTRTDSFDETINDVLDGLAVDVARVRVDRELPETEPVPATRQEGDTTIIPVFEEVMVVEKRLVLREEIHITQRATRENVSIPVTLRRQEAVVDRQPVADPDVATDTDRS